MGTESCVWIQRHKKLWTKYGDMNDIMKNGYRICEVDGQKNILIVGINPSLDKNPPNTTYSFAKTKDTNELYWKNVAGMLEDLYDEATYIDVLSCRGSKQDTIKNNIICNQNLFPYVVAQVKLTQKIIEYIIQPKVIIIKNKLARVFFGKDKEFTWMGYKFENIDNEENIDNHKKYEVCRITGFSDREERINKKIFKKTNLKGSIVCFTRSSSYLSESEWKDYYPDPQTIKHWREMVINKR